MNIDSGAPGANQVVIGRDDAGTALNWWVGINAGDGKASFILRDTTGAGAAADLNGVGTKDLSDGSWHHVVAVRDDTRATLRLLVNDTKISAFENSWRYQFQVNPLSGKAT